MNKIKRFDKLEFEIINCANSGLYSMNDDYKQRALIMMKEGILKENPTNKWSQSGWKFTDMGLEYYNLFMKSVRNEHGHIWITYKESNPSSYDDSSEYGKKINIFAYSVGSCNGPKCKNCGFSFCEHCNSEFEIQKCSNRK